MHSDTIRAVAVLTAMAAPALAENLTAIDPSLVMLAMQKEGFLVKDDTAEDGTPKLVSRVSHTEFQVYFYGCEAEGDPCTSIQFSAGYNLDGALSASRMNQWNRENRFARAFIDDDGDPFLKMDLALHADGTGAANFAQVLEIWRTQVDEFEEFVDW